MKLVRDPVTLDAAVEVGDKRLILRDDVTPQDLETEPLQDLIVCAV